MGRLRQNPTTQLPGAGAQWKGAPATWQRRRGQQCSAQAVAPQQSRAEAAKNSVQSQAAASGSAHHIPPCCRSSSGPG
eukprot:8104566-Heterocapsa_arctica.AAC.1